MERASVSPALAALRDCLRFVLSQPDADADADADSPSRWELPDAVPSLEFAATARRHRVVPLLCTSLDRLRLPEDLAELIRGEGEVERFRCLRQATELARIFAVLAEVGVPALTFKGFALAEQAYGDFAARGAGDHDLLVRPADLTRAWEALADAGWRTVRDYPRLGESWAWRHLLRNGHEMELFGPASVVDLHWRLDPTLAALPGFEDLWRRRSTLTVAGVEIATLGLRDALAHSCSNAAKDDWRWLRSLADVVRLTRRPGVWTDATSTPLKPVQLRTLGIAVGMLGSSTDLPEPVRSRALPAAPRSLAFAERRQAAPLGALLGRFPGVAIVDAVRRRSRGSRTPADLVRVVLAALAPPSQLGNVTDRSAWAAAFRVLYRRSHRFRERVRDWQAVR